MPEQQTYRKKLIEVALPLEAINKESAREKSIRHGHPSTLHLWWARRPLAACRAVLFSSLVDDPSSWPELFPSEEAQTAERQRLFDIIEEMVKWENTTNETVILRAQTEIARSVARNNGDKPPEGAEAVWAYLAEKAPPVLDPFCGGGSIPLEAQRLGLRAYGSDLNPVAVLITKALIEIPPKFAGKASVNPDAQSEPSLIKKEWRGAEGLAEDVRYYGQWMRDEAEKRIGKYYPKVKVTAEMVEERPDLKPYEGKELTVIAWLWARTIECPNPGCRARTPMVRSFWVSTKKGKQTYVHPILDTKKGRVERFEVRTRGEPLAHTTDRSGARCLFCERSIKKNELREISTENGIDPIPMAIVAEGNRARVYLPGDTVPTPNVDKPDVPFLQQQITNDRRWFSPPLYGLPNFDDLFTSRQLLALTTFSDLVQEAREKVVADAEKAGSLPSDARRLAEGGEGVQAYADAVATYLGFALDKSANYWSTLCAWHSGRDIIMSTFGRQALPMVWDYAEANPISASSGNFLSGVSQAYRMLSGVPARPGGEVRQLDAAAHLLKADACISTDPPYYDNIGYADLSDFFYVWLRRTLSTVYPELFSTLLTPKTQELIASPYRHDGSKAEAKSFFEAGLGNAFAAMCEGQRRGYPLTVFYAFKQAETAKSKSAGIDQTASTGWETMLNGLIEAGFSIRGTWPVRTELVTNLKNSVNALATSVVLVCYPRIVGGKLATRRDFLAELKSNLPKAMTALQQGNIAPVDLAQAAIGPGMGIFSAYGKVMEADGSAMTVRTALSLINQILDEVLAEQEGEFDSDTRWALTWFEQQGLSEGPFGVANNLATAKNTSVSGLQDAGIVQSGGGKVRLLGRDDLSSEWDPIEDARPTVWEATQHLIRVLDDRGEEGASHLLSRLGGLGETARDLAYRLFSICERKKWAQEALAYNSLVTAWPEILRLAQQGEQTAVQGQLL